MTVIWHSSDMPVEPRIGPTGWARALARGAVLAVVTYGGLMLLLAVRLFEWPFGRPVTPYITQFVCKAAFVILGIRFVVRGRPMTERGAVVANHASWLDIFTLNAPQRVFFVSKDEVRRWFAIGPLARATGTVFIERRRRHARKQKAIFSRRLRRGNRLLFFPEGTSTDGMRTLPFKSTLFAAFFDEQIVDFMHIQPVTVVYHAPPGADPRFYGWWGDMAFGAHLLKVLAAPRQGMVEVVFHVPVRVADFRDRKALSLYCEARVREGLDL